MTMTMTMTMTMAITITMAMTMTMTPVHNAGEIEKGVFSHEQFLRRRSFKQQFVKDRKTHLKRQEDDSLLAIQTSTKICR